MMICLHVLPRLPLDGFLRNLILETILDICIEYPNLIKTGKKYGKLYMETEIHSSVAGEIKALSSRAFVSGCFDSRRSINTTRKRRPFTVCVRRWADNFCLHCNIFIYIGHIWIKPVLCSCMVSIFLHTSP
jgi:hypothetical protein